MPGGMPFWMPATRLPLRTRIRMWAWRNVATVDLFLFKIGFWRFFQ